MESHMKEVIKPGRVYEDAMEREGCRFCKEDWRAKALASYGGWIAVHNEFPRVDANFVQPEYQIVLTPTRHVTDRISGRGFLAIAHLRDQLVKRFGLHGYGICIREGDRLWSGKTVPHVHAHLVVPQIMMLADGTPHASIFNFPVGDRPKPALPTPAK